jgi:hypothetical protein
MEEFKSELKTKIDDRYMGHGLPNVFRSKILFKKIIWIFAWLLGATLTVYLIAESIDNYLSYEVEIKSRIEFEKPILFPKVTFCNMDPFVTNESIKFLANYIRNDEIYSEQVVSLNLSNTSSDLELVNYFIDNQHDFNFKVKSLYQANSTQAIETKKSFGHDINTFVYKCRFGMWKCNLTSDFEWSYNFKYGNCYTFNAVTKNDVTDDPDQLKPPFRLYKPGVQNGLQISLFVGKSDKFSSFANNIGAKVFNFL